MKRLLTLPAVLGLVACGTGALQANDLFNANLDTTAKIEGGQNNPCPVGWTVEAFKSLSGTYNDGADSETWCNVADTGGSGLFFKPFAGTTNLVTDLVTVYFYQDNPATPGTKYTLSGYAAGEANYCGFMAGPTMTLFVIEFLDNTSTVISSNATDLIAAGLPNGGPGSMAQFTTPEVTAPAGTVTVRAGAFMIDAYSTTGSQSFFVDAFDLESVAPEGSPVITNQPSQTTVALGGTATFTVGVSNTAGAQYQWQLYSTNISNAPGHISGANGPTLTITGVGAADVGHYRVHVSNSIGGLYSKEATLAIVGLGFYPVVQISGKIGDTYEVDYATALAPTTWIPFSTNKLNNTTELVLDPGSPGSTNRFYRAVFQH